MRKGLVVAATAGIWLGVSGTAGATTIANVVCDVEKVERLPNETAPTHVVVHGVFARAVGGPTKAYGSPERGYLYFSCAAGEESKCIMQWKDLAAAVGSAQCAGIGQAGDPLPTVRADGAPLSSPDVYPTGMGVMMSEWHGGACSKVKAVPSPSPDAGPSDASPADGSVKDTGASTDTGSTTEDTGAAADTGTTPVDTGSTAPPAASPSDSSGGCSFGAAKTAGASVVAPLAAVLLALARRRRG